jgi:septal ring factor EnvC (AmiA/AmiB activator)
LLPYSQLTLDRKNRDAAFAAEKEALMQEKTDLLEEKENLKRMLEKEQAWIAKLRKEKEEYERDLRRLYSEVCA